MGPSGCPGSSEQTLKPKEALPSRDGARTCEGLEDRPFPPQKSASAARPPKGTLAKDPYERCTFQRTNTQLFPVPSQQPLSLGGRPQGHG